MEQTRLRIELQAPTQSLVDAIDNNADAISDMVSAGVKKAVNGFDFESEVERVVTKMIRDYLEGQLVWSKVDTLIRNKIKVTVKKEIDAYMSKIKIEMT